MTSPCVSALQNLRENHPLIHCITNYVTVNDVANALLAIGASPVMADEVDDAVAITAIANGLVLNIGTLNRRTIDAMRAAGHRASELGHPIILDPVGAGASPLRTETAVALATDLQPSVIRGNISEIKALMGAAASTQGVDAALADAIDEGHLDAAIAIAHTAASAFSTIVAITGAIDIVTDAHTTYLIRAGRREMGLITGTGCMLSGLTGAFVAANPDQPLAATASAVATMGIAGERGWAQADGRGTGSYRVALIDALSTLTPDDLAGNNIFEIRK
ncbi:MAG: hydroxyethylthiazole kinase [Corynebacterium sp.]|nr:hydroxyethylthiazole kinase [Corynebacterium sp.]